MNIQDREDDRIVIRALSTRYSYLKDIVSNLRHRAALDMPQAQAKKIIQESEAEMGRINAMLTRWRWATPEE